ncbi:MAG TPA: PTS sugar transporter subunit IIA [Methylovirgula sp.]|nr:PTS sugar transporter subunit IIA [Methylovirgula sp.]
MEIVELIKPEHVISLRAGNKAQLLQELARRAAHALGSDPQAILDPVLEREILGSTGVGSGVAIPHARVPGLKDYFALFARLEKPVDFDAVDGKPVDLVVLLLVPANADKPHLTALACVSRRLRDPEIARRLRATLEPSVLYDLLTIPNGAPAVR